MNDEMNLNHRALLAQQDIDLADLMVREYMPFIKSETARTIERIPVEGEDDELSIALMGFHEAIESYDQSKGNFLAFASMIIKRRLIDYARMEDRYRNRKVPLDDDMLECEAGTVRLHIDSDDIVERELLKWEIQQFTTELWQLGISVTDVEKESPKRKKSVDDCIAAVNYIISVPEIRAEVLTRATLPKNSIIENTSISRRTLERHRKYIIAIAIIYFRGYDGMIGHIREVFKFRKGGK